MGCFNHHALAFFLFMVYKIILTLSINDALKSVKYECDSSIAKFFIVSFKEFCTLTWGIFYSPEFFKEDGSLKEVHKINEMYASLQEELKVS